MRKDNASGVMRFIHWIGCGCAGVTFAGWMGCDWLQPRTTAGHLPVPPVDIGGSDDQELVTGGLHAYPLRDRTSRVTIWRRAESP